MLFDWTAWTASLAALLILATLAWAVSIVKRDVSIVDSLWSLMFLVAALGYMYYSGAQTGLRASVVFCILTIWALRLSAHITWRNWGEGEDRRYREIRRNNEPHFWFKSWYLVFGLQSVLAWLIVVPVLIAVSSDHAINWWDMAGAALWGAGFVFETVSDWQLARFKAEPANKGQVLDRGLWRYSRHPNYFGEACIWWGFYLIAIGAGAWWSIFSPLLITFLLLKVSGVSLLEKDISDRRPAYRDYVKRTSAFIPAPPRNLDQPHPGLTAK